MKRKAKGVKRQSPTTKKYHAIVYMSDHELGAIRNASYKAGLSISMYLRNRLIDLRARERA